MGHSSRPAVPARGTTLKPRAAWQLVTLTSCALCGVPQRGAPPSPSPTRPRAHNATAPQLCLTSADGAAKPGCCGQGGQSRLVSSAPPQQPPSPRWPAGPRPCPPVFRCCHLLRVQEPAPPHRCLSHFSPTSLPGPLPARMAAGGLKPADPRAGIAALWPAQQGSAAAAGCKAALHLVRTPKRGRSPSQARWCCASASGIGTD